MLCIQLYVDYFIYKVDIQLILHVWYREVQEKIIRSMEKSIFFVLVTLSNII